MDPLNRRDDRPWLKPNNICMPDNHGDYEVKENSDLLRVKVNGIERNKFL
jgi:hypothetical protein